MKNKLTEQQKLNEFVSKLFTALLNKKAQKMFNKLQSSDPEIRKGIKDLNNSVDDIKQAIIKRYGKERAQKIFDA